MSVDEKEWEKTLSTTTQDTTATATVKSSSGDDGAAAGSTTNTAAAADASSGPGGEEQGSGKVPAAASASASDLPLVDHHHHHHHHDHDDPNKQAVEVMVVNNHDADNHHSSYSRAGGGANEEADVFRIQGDANRADASSSSFGGTATATTATRGEHNNDSLYVAADRNSEVKEWGVVTLAVQEIAGNICVIFPSATSFHHLPASSTAADDHHHHAGRHPQLEHHHHHHHHGHHHHGHHHGAPTAGPNVNIPYVALHTSFLKTRGAGNTARALDNIFRAVSSARSGFLSHDFYPEEWWNEQERLGHIDSTKVEVEKACLQKLRLLLNKTTTSTDKKAPFLLFLILLVRIEVAVYLAIRHNSNVNSSVMDHEPAKKKSGGGKGKAKGGDTAAAANSKNNMPEATTTTTTTTPLERFDSDRLVAMVDQIEALSKLSQALDKTRLNYIMAPLIETGHCSMEVGGPRSSKGNKGHNPPPPDTSKIQNLLITPLPMLVRMFASAAEAETVAAANQSSSSSSFRVWDSAWTATLQRVAEFAKSLCDHHHHHHHHHYHHHHHNNRRNSASNKGNNHNKKSNNNNHNAPIISNTHNNTNNSAESKSISSGDNAEWMDTNDNTSSTAQPPTNGHNGPNAKKKKKAKRRKKRKNATNDATADPPTSTNDKNQPAEVVVAAADDDKVPPAGSTDETKQEEAKHASATKKSATKIDKSVTPPKEEMDKKSTTKNDKGVIAARVEEMDKKPTTKNDVGVTARVEEKDEKPTTKNDKGVTPQKEESAKVAEASRKQEEAMSTAAKKTSTTKTDKRVIEETTQEEAKNESVTKKPATKNDKPVIPLKEETAKKPATKNDKSITPQKGEMVKATESTPPIVEKKEEVVNDASAPSSESKAVLDTDGGAPSSEEDSGKDTQSKADDAKDIDSKKIPLLISEDTASTRSESTKQDEVDGEGEKKPSSKSDVTVSRIHGVGTVVVAPSAAETTQPAAKVEPKGKAKVESTAAAADNHDEWETVEVKGRGGRKKSGRSGGNQLPANGNASQNHGAKKPKKRSSESRRRTANRKMVKEILSSVMDSVDEEIKKRSVTAPPVREEGGDEAKKQLQQGKSPLQKSGAAKVAPVAWKDASRKPGLPDTPKQETTLRDVVVGRQSATAAAKRPQPATASAKNISKKNTPSSSVVQPSAATTRAVPKMATSPVKGTKGALIGADQNTAATIPETVSAVSDPRRAAPNRDIDITRSDSSSTDTDDHRKQDRAAIPTKQVSSPAPPLPTLLNPGNTNSASSSVASSLEAPHASHGHHHTSSSNEADVGYHLLDVCDRLTRDMHMFMARRATALNTRRRERGALLSALQDSVSSIWAGHSHVQLYGSCATMLDLPSSDLDVVVCGLDHLEATLNNPMSPHKNGPNFNGTPDKMNQHAMPFVPPHINAERVMQLAADLERQPWAVQVKAIPTASVPVVKVLADPLRLPGAIPPGDINGEEWMMQQHHAGHQAGVPSVPVVESSPNHDSLSAGQSQSNGQHFQAPPITTPVWRGADVINGLLKLDITFEGPEHGGIGSTEFSQRVVQNVCDETGLAGESTAFVQVVLVVKELLAQRRLNEPFSGGLSSYALLLLVLAVMCERKVIGEELERVERQRRAVAAGGGNSEMPGANKSSPSHPGKGAAQQRSAAAAPNAARGNNSKNPDGQADKSKSSPDKPPHTSQNSKKSASAQPGKRAPQGGNQQPVGHQQKGTTPTATSRAVASPSSSEKKPAKAAGNSWASIAMGKNDEAAAKTAPAGQNDETLQQKSPQTKKPSSFADAVARNAGGSPPGKVTAAQPAAQPKHTNNAPNKGANNNDAGKKTKLNKHNAPSKKEESKIAQPKNTGKTAESVAIAMQQDGGGVSKETVVVEVERKIDADEKTSKFNNYSSEPVEPPAISSNQSVYPQGFNDIIEVLCSGETTPGKLLMHVLLFYGQHFDAHATAIDISGKHHRDIPNLAPPYTHLSPYLQRRSAGNIDPITGMLTVDPIVVYDPLEGAENNNVARRCFLWSNVKWVFAQSYMTLSSAVERNTTPPGTPGTVAKNEPNGSGRSAANPIQGGNGGPEPAAWNGPYNPSDRGNLFDPSSPLLELLLSF